jgi:hypothetical protein
LGLGHALNNGPFFDSAVCARAQFGRWRPGCIAVFRYHKVGNREVKRLTVKRDKGKAHARKRVLEPQAGFDCLRLARKLVDGLLRILSALRLAMAL